MLSHQNEGMLFICMGEIINLGMLYFIIFAFITTFQKQRHVSSSKLSGQMRTISILKSSFQTEAS